VIVITHKLHEVKAVADRVTVLRRGRHVATVSAAQATQRSLAALMVGREIDEARRLPRAAPPGDDVMLRVDGLTVAGDRGGPALEEVSLSIRSGEIVGVAGVAGNGQRELAEALYGLRTPVAGSIDVGGKALELGDPRAAIAASVAHVPEDRLGTGLAPGLTVASNVVLKSYRDAPVSRGPWLALRRMREAARALVRRYEISTPSTETPVRNLSGGNLQKLVLGREFEGTPRVLIAAQPTRGLDVGAIETIHDYLRQAAAGGVAILLISEDLDELRALADRILVMYEGAVVGELDAATATIEQLGYLMAGGRGED
jgi:simple sugar transport system ATP-binding protein